MRKLLQVPKQYVILFLLNQPYFWEDNIMEHIKTVNNANLKESCAKGGCGECQASCQSACKTSCTVANQECENESRKAGK